MPVTLYSDKFRSEAGSGAGESSAQLTSAASGTASSVSGAGARARAGRSGWEVIKRAIFTPLGTKDTAPHRRRRSRRNLHDNREQKGDTINEMESISSGEDPLYFVSDNQERKWFLILKNLKHFKNYNLIGVKISFYRIIELLEIEPYYSVRRSTRRR